MTLFADMSATHAAAFYIGLLIVVMLGLKIYVGGQRAKYKVAPGDTSNPEFAKATRVQLNAVEDVPVLMVGLLALAGLNMPAVYIHVVGGVLVLARVLHAWGLSRPKGQSVWRLVGTMGTMIAYLGIGGALLVHAFVPPG